MFGRNQRAHLGPLVDGTALGPIIKAHGAQGIIYTAHEPIYPRGQAPI